MWIAWCALHSFLISSRWTSAMRTVLGKGYAFYRFGYTIASIGTLLPILYYTRSIDTLPIASWSGMWNTLRGVLLALAAIVLALGAVQYDQPYFFGIRQIRDFLKGQSAAGPEFTGGGILRVVRHPYYTAGMIFVLFYPDLSVASIVTQCILLIYFIFGARLEEKKLVKEFGERYITYQRETGMFLPKLKGTTK